MQNIKQDQWQWPEELDALIAAPKHHKLLFENETVRVIDAFIPPGEITHVHTHKWAASQYIISWSHFTRYDHDGNIILESKNLNKQPTPATSLWSEPIIPHALKNTGDTDLHIICVEIKK